MVLGDSDDNRTNDTTADFCSQPKTRNKVLCMGGSAALLVILLATILVFVVVITVLLCRRRRSSLRLDKEGKGSNEWTMGGDCNAPTSQLSCVVVANVVFRQSQESA